MTPKDQIRALLDRLPEDCSLEEVQYHVYVLQAIASGESDIATGNILSHEAVASELRQKWLIGRAG